MLVAIVEQLGDDQTKEELSGLNDVGWYHPGHHVTKAPAFQLENCLVFKLHDLLLSFEEIYFNTNRSMVVVVQREIWKDI